MGRKTHPRDVRNAKKNVRRNWNNLLSNQTQKPEQQPTFLDGIKCNVPNLQIPNEEHRESDFVRKMKKLTKGFSGSLYNSKVLYSDHKGTDKMNFEEFIRYEELYSSFVETLQADKDNYLKAYNKLLESYPEDSDEAIILQGLIDNLPKEPER